MNRTILAAAACAALQAHAQTPGNAPPAQPTERTLRPVVVTATPGVAQQAFDTAASIDVIDAATIRNSQLQVNISESLVRVPGVVALNRQNYAQDLQISVRGFGARSTFGVRGLRLYSDGIPATAPDGQGQVSHFDLSSAERIEVLRGPFSALYGNSSGGVISLFTADGAPGMQAEGAAAIGTDGIRRVNARFAGDSGSWNWNLGATHFETQGFRDHSAARREGLNGKLKWKGLADTRVTLVANAVEMPDVEDPLGLTRPEFQANRRQASPAALLFNTRKSVDQQQLGVIVEHQLNAANGLKLTTWRGQRGTEQFQAIPVGTQTPITHPGGVIDLQRDYMGVDGQWIYKSRLAGKPLTVTAGLYADQLKEHRQGFLNFTSPTTLGVKGALRRDEDNRVRSFDQYAQANWESERFGVTAGLRHSTVRFRSEDHFIAGTNGNDSGSAKYSATTPMAGLVYHVNENLNVYGSVGRGFETPTFNEVSYRPGGQTGLNFDLKPAYSRHYELGVKAEPLRNWRINAALFQANTRDEIVVLTNQGGRSTFQNASNTRRRGLEAALAGSFAEAWSTYAAFTWLDATYRSAFSTCPGAPCPTAANPAVPVPQGNRIPGIPRASAFAELVYRHRPWGLEAGAEVRYTGRIAVDDRNTDFAPSATVFNLRLALAQNIQRWTVREFVRVDNIADRETIGSVIVNEGNSRFFEPAPGRTWLLGVSATYAF